MNRKAFDSLKEGQLIVNETDGSILTINKRNNNHLYCSSIISQFKVVRQEGIDIVADYCTNWEVYDPIKLTNQKLINIILLKEMGMIKLYLGQVIKMKHDMLQGLNHLI